MHMQTLRIVRNNNDHTKLPKSLNRLRHFPQLFYLQSPKKINLRPKTLNYLNTRICILPTPCGTFSFGNISILNRKKWDYPQEHRTIRFMLLN